MGATSKMYVAQRLMKYIGSNLGYDIKIESVAEGVAGVLPVFYTKAAARKWYGRKVKLTEIQLDQDAV